MSNQDDRPNTDVGISADAALAALTVLGAYVQSGGAVAATAGLAATDTQNKTDVNVPELMTGMNGLAQQMAIVHQLNLNAIAVKDAQSAAFYTDLTRQMAVDHRDQNHTKQALAVTFPFVVAGDAAEASAND